MSVDRFLRVSPYCPLKSPGKTAVTVPSLGFPSRFLTSPFLGGFLHTTVIEITTKSTTITKPSIDQLLGTPSNRCTGTINLPPITKATPYPMYLPYQRSPRLGLIRVSLFWVLLFQCLGHCSARNDHNNRRNGGFHPSDVSSLHMLRSNSNVDNDDKTNDNGVNVVTMAVRTTNLADINEYCGLPGIANPWEAPLQECSPATSMDRCITERFFQNGPCSWKDDSCTSEADQAGDTTICATISRVDQCTVSGFATVRNCQWYHRSPSGTTTTVPSFPPSGSPSDDEQQPVATTMMPSTASEDSRTTMPSFSPSLSLPDGSYCGLAGIEDPWEEPIHLCGAVSNDQHGCDSSEYFTAAQCVWAQHGCVPALSTDADVCFREQTKSMCEAKQYAVIRTCVWYSPAHWSDAPSALSSMPSSSPSMLPSKTPVTAIPTNPFPSNTPSFGPTATPSVSPSFDPTTSAPSIRTMLPSTIPPSTDPSNGLDNDDDLADVDYEESVSFRGPNWQAVRQRDENEDTTKKWLCPLLIAFGLSTCLVVMACDGQRILIESLSFLADVIMEEEEDEEPEPESDLVRMFDRMKAMHRSGSENGDDK